MLLASRLWNLLVDALILAGGVTAAFVLEITREYGLFFHAGDPLRTAFVQMCSLALGCLVGAVPTYMLLLLFGRSPFPREMALSRRVLFWFAIACAWGLVAALAATAGFLLVFVSQLNRYDATLGVTIASACGAAGTLALSFSFARGLVSAFTICKQEVLKYRDGMGDSESRNVMPHSAPVEDGWQ